MRDSNRLYDFYSKCKNLYYIFSVVEFLPDNVKLLMLLKK